MVGVVVEKRAYTHVTREATEDKWDGDDTATDHHIEGIKRAVMYTDLEVGFELEEGRTYYLLYALYSTGDSFHHESGVIEYIGLYQDEKVAKENQGRLKKHNDVEEKLTDRWDPPSKAVRNKLAKNHNSYSCSLVTENGQEYLLHVPWHGYFEHLEGVDIQPVSLV